MIIKNEIQYRDFEYQVELLIKKGTELGDMELLSDDDKVKFVELSRAVDEYGRKNYPLPSEKSQPLIQPSYSPFRRMDMPMEVAFA